jgi:hypothetical protein
MSQSDLDPRREKMVAALYGELTPEEEKEFFQLLTQDDELRAEWEELNAARAFLKHGEEEEKAPSFVFMPPIETSAAREESPVGLWERLRGIVFSPAGAFAAATAVLVILIATGFRVDRVENGLAFRFGSPETSTPAVENLAQRTEGIPLVPSGRGPDYTPGQPSELTAAEPQYLTRADLDSYGNNFSTVMNAMIESYDQRRSNELGFLLKMMYDELMERQQQDYSELSSQIQRVGYGLVLGRGAEGQLESLIKKGERYELTPVSPATYERGEPK